MKKVRIYEYAKEVGKQSKDLITVLKDANIEVSNHMSMLTEEGLAKLDSVFKKQEKAAQNDQSSNNEGKKNKKKKIKKEKNKKAQKQQPAIIEAPSEETISEDTILVKDDQLSLAIGKKGQNVRLAAKLTGWKIDIKAAE